jgi:glycosyltransferase involved in cell wall biosynthesis
MKITIITINYNNLIGLKKTFDSVKSQFFMNYEYIIIDGGSTDGSKEYLIENSNQIDYWVCELDKGVYHAMNKGLIVATGEYVIFMNSGDVFYNNHVLFDFQNFNPTCDLIYGLSRWSQTGLFWNPPREIKLKDTLARVLLPHQATFYKVLQLKLNKGFKEEFSIISDWGVFIDFIIKGFSYDKIDLTICLSEPAGLSQKSSFTLHLQKMRYIQKYHFKYIFYYPFCMIRDFIKNRYKYYIKPFIKRFSNNLS